MNDLFSFAGNTALGAMAQMMIPAVVAVSIVGVVLLKGMDAVSCLFFKKGC